MHSHNKHDIVCLSNKLKEKEMKKILTVLLIVVIAFSFAACGTESESQADKGISETKADKADAEVKPIVLKLSENQPAENPVTVAMMKFAELVEDKSEGALIIDVNHSAALGQETENIEQITAGILDIARVNTVTLAQTINELQPFTLPYIFLNQEHKYKVLDGEIGRGVLDTFPNYGMVALGGYLEAGSRCFYTVEKPVKSLEDLQGQKIRVQKADVPIKMTELLGAVPTPMAYGEVFTSLQTGVIDGAENDFVSYVTSGHYEVAKHYTLDRHVAPPALVIMSQKVYDSLTADQQAILQEAAMEATLFERDKMNAFQEESRAKAEASGCIVYEVDTVPFQEAVAPIYDQYEDHTQVIDAIRATK